MSVSLKETFLYFAYGSNLLKKRIRINNPSAHFIGIGKLDNHHLDFIKYSENWRGSSATIVPVEGCHVWGAVWQLDIIDMPALDIQEGVDTNWYFPKTVDIVTLHGETLQCRTYQQTVNPVPCKKIDELPEERRPSSTYLECILTGATECQLPNDYIQNLRKIPHNGNEASPKMIEKLKN
ncbi:gamma-glutamylcyclotransferase-like [Ostrinia nubilalis]|uniref:gamma-glutamylcyclotransferase-like n=1 Tax=Ostrinia nubilalis TaxID=29057 RepID=UPI003082318C